VVNCRLRGSGTSRRPDYEQTHREHSEKPRQVSHEAQLYHRFTRALQATPLVLS
jgi:hypothetical protein